MSDAFTARHARVERCRIDVVSAERELIRSHALLEQYEDEYVHKKILLKLDIGKAEAFVATEKTHLREALSALDHPFTETD